ncbi:MAG: DPP IV N-terminal domain-containing protein, partial [Bacteroidota bacterium]
MKQVIQLSLISATILWSCSASQEKEKIEKPASYTIEQFMDINQIFGSSFSPDESKILISSKETGIFNAYQIDINTGSTTQLTSSTGNAIFARAYFPNDERILYTSDQGGNEITHIYVRQVDGTNRDLTPDSTAKSSFYGWSYDRSKFYYGSNKRDPKYFDLYAVNIESESESDVYQENVLYTNDKGYNVSSISTTGRYLALNESITTNNSNMYLLDTESGETKLLSPHEGDAQFGAQYFSLDDSYLFYLTNENSEFMHLRKYNITTGESEDILREDWDISYAYQSHGGKYRVAAINNDARTEIKIFDNTTGELLELANLPVGDITSVNISDSEKLMSFYV